MTLQGPLPVSGLDYVPDEKLAEVAAKWMGERLALSVKCSCLMTNTAG